MVTTPKTILYVIGSLDRGGAEGQLIKLARGLDTQRWSARVFCLSHPGVQAKLLTQHRIPVDAPHTRVHRQKFFAGKSVLDRAVRALRSMIVLAKIVRNVRPDIIHFFLPEAYIAGGYVTVVSPVAVRVMSRRSLNLYQQKIPFARRLEAWLHRRMDACIGNSKAVTAELIDEGAPAAKVKLIHNGLDCQPPDTDPSLRRSRLAELTISEPVVICTVIANLIAYKGHLDLVDAVANCLGTLKHPLKVLLIGRDDGMQAKIQQRIDAHGLNSIFVFLGSREDTRDWLCASDVAVLPSHEEGFSNVILEAMACALPVLATDVGGNSEAVLDGVTGVLVPKHNPQGLGEALARLVNDAELRVELGRHGFDRVSELFTLQRCVRQHDELYRELLKLADPAGHS